MQDTHHIEIAGHRIAAGTKGHVTVPVVRDLDDSEIGLTINVIAGARPGPTLAVVNVLHGGEWFAAETGLGVIETSDPADMSGNLLVVPVANPLAFATGTRNIVDESDSPDLNRSFGGTQAWLADQLAQAITTHVLSNADAVIDYHNGVEGAAMGSVTCGRDFSDRSISEQSLALAKAYGGGHVRWSDVVTKFPGPKSMVGYAGEVVGIPGMISEIGGCGFDPELEAEWIEQNLQGVRGVMQHMGILEGDAVRPDKTLVYSSVTRVNPTTSGMLEPLFPAAEVMAREVEAGELLGRVWSPYTFEVVEELRSPARGLVDMVAQTYPVRPGDWAYLVVDLDHEETRWVDD
jgi:predicted deacylase